MTPQHVTVGVDGSPGSVRALDQAAEEADRRGVGLRVVYAVQDRDAAGPVLDSAVTRVRARHPGLPVEPVAVAGGAARALARESAQALLTVVGSRGLGALTALLCGAVGPRLLARAHGPVMVVRGARPYRADRHDVLLGPEHDTDTAVYALQEAARRGTRLQVVTGARAPYPAQDPRPPRGTRTGYTALVEATRGAAVMVVGTPRAAGTRHGGPARALLHHAHCPVIYVPAG
ncbi:universal stress protein [Streptomyces sp. NPDC091377]|uniref:universal stress protein n=1 Tax=Streptomyces sp. NPDC091377 TaxID=3365995 RepID=UPI0037FF5BF4